MTNYSTEYKGEPLVGTISTLYRDREDARFALALETAENYRFKGVPLIVVDASPEEATWVRDALIQREARVLSAQRPGIASQVQEGVARAIADGAEKVVRHEPEKIRMIHFGDEIQRALEDTDVLVIGRTAMAELTLPPVQRRTEHLAGWALEKAFDMPPDALSGGRGYSVAGAETLARYPFDQPNMNNWIFLYDNVLRAREMGLTTGGLAVDLVHPLEMVIEEAGNPAFDLKRYSQFGLQLNYLLRRPDVKAEAAPIVEPILDGLSELGDDYTNAQFEGFLTDLENQFASEGYVKVA